MRRPRVLLGHHVHVPFAGQQQKSARAFEEEVSVNLVAALFGRWRRRGGGDGVRGNEICLAGVKRDGGSISLRN